SFRQLDDGTHAGDARFGAAFGGKERQRRVGRDLLEVEDIPAARVAGEVIGDDAARAGVLDEEAEIIGDAGADRGDGARGAVEAVDKQRREACEAIAAPYGERPHLAAAEQMRPPGEDPLGRVEGSRVRPALPEGGPVAAQ